MGEDKKASDPLFSVIVGAAVLLGVAYIGLFFFRETEPILAEIPMFIPMYHGILVLEIFTIAFLVLGRHRALGDPVSYWIGIAIASFAISNTFYVLAWPGLRADGQSLIGHLSGTAAWMITLGQIIFCVLIIVAVSVQWPGRQVLKGQRLVWSVAGWLILFVLVYILLAMFEEKLPVIISPKGTFTPLLLVLSGVIIILYTAGVVLLTRYYRKFRDLLSGYVTLAMICLFYGSIGVVMAGRRYAVIWYITRLLVLVGSAVILFGLLWEYVRLYRKEQDKTRELEKSITERKRAEEELRESENKYRFMTDNVADIIWTVDMNLSFTYISPSVQKVRGFTLEEAMSQKIYEVLTPDSLQYALHVMEEENKALIGNPGRIKDKLSIELEEYCEDGSTIWTENELKYLPGQDGKPVGIIGVTRDITKRKQAEDGKRNLEERLQRAEKMEALGTLAGGVAHDLNNVLGVIVGYAELLLSEVDELSPIKSRLTKIMNGSEKAAAIVQDLLTLARRSVSGRNVLNLNKIILDYKDSPEFEKLSFYHSGVRIKINLEPSLLNMSGSSVHLGKALFNLVVNAAEAMPKGGELTIKTANQYLDKPIYGYDEVREGDYVVLSVFDTGQGIPAKDLQRIFEPFYTKKVMGRSGTGLGLAVVWGTVKDHQGYIDVQSEEGKGSTFTLYFPVTREDVTSAPASVSIAKYMGKGETILVVDDVREQRDLAAEMLKKLNYQVSSVVSGEEAIAYMREHKVDLLVLDMIMDPGIDGLDTYRSVLTIQPKQKAIIVSGFSDTDRVHAAQTIGAGEYVKKPYVIEKLGMAVKNELDRK